MTTSDPRSRSVIPETRVTGITEQNESGWTSAHRLGVTASEAVGGVRPSFVVNRPDWMDRGSCVTDGDLADFFDEAGDEGRGRALALCAKCSEVERCLAYAMEAGDRLYGIWGGTTRGQRMTRRKKRNKRTKPEAA